MELIKLTDEIQRKRSCGVVSLFVLERKETIGWEELILLKTSFLAENSSVDKFKKEIHPVVSRSLANKILTTLLHKDMAYQCEIMPLRKAEELSGRFFTLFDDGASYYSNSTWNKLEYSTKGFEFGLSSWAGLTEATFDSGIIVCDKNRVGVLWFEDED